MVKQEIGDLFLYLIRALSSNENWHVALSGISESNVKNEFYKALKRHFEILGNKLLTQSSGFPDSHKQAAAICLAVLDVYPLKSISEPTVKKKEFHFPNEFIAMKMGRYHVRSFITGIDPAKPNTILGTYKDDLIFDINSYDNNFMYMLWEERQLSHCVKYDLYERIEKKCINDDCEWRPACRYGKEHNYFSLSKLFYHFENDIKRESKSSP